MNEDLTTRSGTAGQGRKKILVLLLAAGAIAVFLVFFRDKVSLATAAAYEQQLRGFTIDHYAAALAIAFFAYVVVTGLSLPGAAVMTLVLGWLFGFLPAVILVSFASTTGATLAFLLSRYLFRDAIQARFGERLEAFNRALAREGAFYLFTLRLIVAIPFFVINLVMGLTQIGAWTFWWVSQLGMLPGTAVYVWAGSSVPTLAEMEQRGIGSILTPGLIGAFAALGLFPLIVKKIVQTVRGKDEETKDDGRRENDEG